MIGGGSPRWSSRSILLLALVAFALAAGIGLRDPSPPDEPRFVLAAQHMVASGDWLVPRRGIEYYAEKPPVFMWLQASAATLVGDWRIAFLLPSLLAALATLALTWDLAGRLWGRHLSPYAAGALFVCLQFGLQAKRGQIDMVLVFLTTLSLWGLLRHLLRGPAWGPFWLGAFAAGVGTVTKGVGFLPLLVLVPWGLARRTLPPVHAPDQATAWRWLLFVLAFVAGTAVWLGPLGAALASGGDPALAAYARELLVRQTGERYANAWHHVQPAWYYAQVTATLWLPGALLLPWLVPAWWRRLRRGDPRLLLLLGWAALVLLFFTASPGKRGVYVFPALPALCLAAAPLLPGLLRRRSVRMALSAYMLLLAGAVLLMGVAGLAGWSDWAQRLAAERAIGEPALRDLLGWLTLFGVAGVLVALAHRRRHVGHTLLLFTALLWSVHGVGLAPALDATSSARTLMQAVSARIGPDAELGLVAWREQHLLQAGRPVVDFGFKAPWHVQWNAAQAWLQQAPDRRWVFVLDEALGPCVDRAQAVAIGRSNRRDWLLVPGTAVRAGCTTPAFPSQGGRE